MYELSPISHLSLAAQPVIEKVTPIYLLHTQTWFVGLLAHGSAVKGGFIPGCSDIDLQLYVDNAAFAENGQLPLQLCMAIQRDLVHIDPSPFRYIQCYAYKAAPDKLTQTGPIPGAYVLLAGRLPVAEATAEQLRASAEQALNSSPDIEAALKQELLQHGDSGFHSTFVISVRMSGPGSTIF